MPPTPSSTATPTVALNKYQHLVEQLRARLRGGSVPGGERLATFSELQAEFSVTPGTVNRALIVLEQEGLIERRRGSGVYVAQSPGKASRHGLVGVSGFGFQFGQGSSYWTSLIDGMREAAEQFSTELVLLDYKAPRGLEKLDGLLICDWSGEKTLQRVPPTLPCVSVLVPVDGMASVHADDEAALYEATDHLLRLGHRRIAYLSGGDRTVSPRRRAGYREALKTAGVIPDNRWERPLPPRSGAKNQAYGQTFIEAGRGAMEKWLAEDWRELGCTAVLAHNDETAIGAVNALHAAGLGVPRDVSVIGFDGLEIGRYFSPQLATLSVPLHEIGTQAMELLQKQVEQDTVQKTHIVLQASLYTGNSTAAPCADVLPE